MHTKKTVSSHDVCIYIVYIHVIKGGEPRVHSEELAAGDHVKVELDPDVWKRMQQGHGEWNDRMAEVIVWCMSV